MTIIKVTVSTRKLFFQLLQTHKIQVGAFCSIESIYPSLLSGHHGL